MKDEITTKGLLRVICPDGLAHSTEILLPDGRNLCKLVDIEAVTIKIDVRDGRSFATIEAPVVRCDVIARDAEAFHRMKDLIPPRPGAEPDPDGPFRVEMVMYDGIDAELICPACKAVTPIHHGGALVAHFRDCEATDTPIHCFACGHRSRVAIIEEDARG